MRCIVCAECADHPKTDTLDDADGTYFITHGGSGLYDPVGMKYLEVFVCDWCLLQAAGVGDVLQATVTETEVSFERWMGEAQPKRH